MLVWIIDDTPSHHRTVAATLLSLPACTHEAFADGDLAVAEYAHRAAHHPARLPQVILMDFFLGSTRGDELTERIRAIHVPRSPLIVGYSSVASGSRQIVAAGGNAIVRKLTAADGTNPELRVYLESLLRIAGA